MESNYGASNIIFGSDASISRTASSQLVLCKSSLQPLKLILPNTLGKEKRRRIKEGGMEIDGETGWGHGNTRISKSLGWYLNRPTENPRVLEP